MREYEVSILFHPDLELNLAPAVERVEKTIADLGGEITQKTEEGRKKLAYTIAGQDSAIFYYYDVKLEPSAVAKLDRALVLMNEVVRHLVVATDPELVEARKERAAEKKEVKEGE
ncbi:MAG: 30S ribosomal protein S6 [Candidatus Nomurabacteria bacterium]|jgi:small subunit ribosomal protein S6|nr:30S ribosomal protein S6 [Candidatus Nomurabacteria bacterium]